MARTNPHHDWPEPLSAPRRSNGAEWESLRNELVALLDQVEDQVASAQSVRPRTQPAAPVPSPAQADRHSEALRSVRQAVTRLADRNPEDRPVMRESVVDAINQIRARQTGATRHAAIAPTPAEPARSDLTDFAKSLDAMAERISRFEASMGEKIEALGDQSTVSAQITQLSEVIEMLAGAVGETGQIKRIEAQIGNLAEMIASDRHASEDATVRRIEDLTVTVEKLLARQLEANDDLVRQTAQFEDRQAQSMATIETSVRNIYDRIDALEASQAHPSADIDRLSRDMAALTEAVNRKVEPDDLLDRIDALGARIAIIEAPSHDEAALLAQSVSVLRDVIADTLQPRFAHLEERMDRLAGPNDSAPIEAIEAQLRQIARRVDETSIQLKELASLESPTPPASPDFEALASLIAEKTRSGVAPLSAEAESLEKADLEALEQRLASLFARSSESDPETGHLAGVRNSIAQVDNRIARLEAMLNSKPTPVAPAAESQPEPSRPRRKPNDAMPVDPTTGEARTHEEKPEDPAPALETEAAEEVAQVSSKPPFALDPDAIDRPAKPQPSFIVERESPFDAAPDERVRPELSMGVSSSTRANFIEAARRSARQPEPEDGDEPKSLIARALARFQRNESQADEHAAPAEAVEPQAEPFASPQRFEEEQKEDEEPGFIARNRRVLLLGTALVIVVALTVPLMVNRLVPAQTATTPEAQAAAETADETEATATEEATAAVEPTAPAPAPAPASDAADEARELMSDIRIIEQQPRLTAAAVDQAALAATPTVDPITTAAISPNGSNYAAASRTSAADAMTSELPEIAVPQGIEPEALRLAAEAGDRYAQFEIGAILTEGTLVEQDLTMAAAWYERSAAQGFAPAQYRLGSLYEGGRGVAQDLDMARLWYQRAAEAGNRMSMHNLASLYAGGELENQDFEAAAHWFEEAASRGLTDSQFNLGMLHARGLGVEQDFEESYVWFSLAARSGDQDAATSRDDVARSLDAEAIQRLDAVVDAWAPAEINIAANFAPIGTWDASFDPGPAIASNDVTLRVQMLLGKLGYDIGSPDGIAGPKTREAVAQFERATGMTETGAINPRLLAVLGSQPV